jgi:2-C-methyl-D-erythritol 4-phosphate cytidylyltransferase
MRIPTNSTFSKEIAKQFKRIFHKDMTLSSLEEIKNLQEDLINPVDTHLINQVSQLRKEDEPKKNVSGSRATRQDSKYGKKFVESPLQVETEKERFGF